MPGSPSSYPPCPSRYEVLETVLSMSGAAPEVVEELCHLLLQKFLSPERLLGLSGRDLLALPCSDPRPLTFLYLVLQVFLMYIAQDPQFPDGTSVVFLTDPPVEKVHVLCLDDAQAANRRPVAQGGDHSVSFTPRQAAERLVQLWGRRAVLVHNHPDGCGRLSRSDRHFAQKLEEPLNLAGIPQEEQRLVSKSAVLEREELMDRLRPEDLEKS